MEVRVLSGALEKPRFLSCQEDVPSRVICANRAPDRTTIARFRVRREQALAQTFSQILGLCAKAGLVSVGVVTLDGTALSGDSSAEAIRSYPSIRQEVDRMLGEAAAVMPLQMSSSARRAVTSCRTAAGSVASCAAQTLPGGAGSRARPGGRSR